MKLAAVAVLLVPMLAHADPRVAAYDGPPGTQQAEDEAPLPPAIAPVATPMTLAASRALASRGLLIGTALTVPEGHVEVAGRTLLPVGALGSINAGLTDSTEVWVDYGKLFGIADDDEVSDTKTYAFGIKQVIAKRATWQVAVSSSIRRVDREQLYSGAVTASGCSDETCHTMYTIGGGIMTAGSSSEATLPVINASMITGGDIAKVTVEGMWFGPAGLAVLGLRLGGSTLAFDLGIAAAIADKKIMPLPMLGLAARI